jgi:LruC domain-containing protein
MKTPIRLIITAFLLLAIGFQSCKKTDTPVDPKKSMDDLIIPNGFVFETTREVDISIQMPESVAFTDMRSRFDIYTSQPAEGGKLITSGSFDQNGTFEGSIVVPSTLTELYVQTLAGAVIVPITPFNGSKEGGVIIDFGENYGNFPPDSLPATLKHLQNTHSSLISVKNQSVVANLVTNGDFSDNNFGTMLNWSSLSAVDEKWWFSRDSRSGYMEWAQAGADGYIRTNNSTNNFYGGTSQMINASAGDLITFTADMKREGTSGTIYSWLYLIPINSSGNALAYYNIFVTNVPTNWVNKTIAATMPSGTVKCQVLFWTNDYTTQSRALFDNAFVTGPVSDSDGDGVDDELDDYPNDPTRAFDVYYPNSADWGTFAFEDLWPGKGDYDFNDLVLDYHYKSVLSSANQLVDLYIDYSVRAVGASLINGFGIMIEGDPTNVQSVTGQNFTEDYLTIAANGTEEDQSNTVIIFFDNAFSMIGSSGGGFINTVPTIPYVEPDTNQLHVAFNVSSTRVVSNRVAPYNPFIIVDKTRGIEVHLAGEEPTDLVDAALFGTWADDTNPAEGKYYQTVNNLPWAIDLPVSFDYPVEQVQIIEAYNFFADWAESGGNLYDDWYEDLTGYRNSENIYAPEE